MPKKPLQPQSSQHSGISNKATPEAKDTSLPGREEEVIDQSADADITDSPESGEKAVKQCLENKADSENAQ